MSYSFNGLRYVAAVVAHGSFSAAARACGVSQPTVSNAIAELEETCGARLFERSTKHLALTPAGAKLLPLVQGVLEAIAELERGSDALKTPSRKMLRVGFSSLLGAHRLGLLFEPFRAQNVDVEIVYKECTVGDMEARLDGASLDVICGIGFRRRKNRGRSVPPNGAVADHARVTLRDVARERLLLTMGTCGLAPATRALFANASLPIDEYAGQALSYGALEEWAELGIGGALIPESHIRRAPSTPLYEAGKPVRLTYEAVWRKDLLVAKHVVAFVRYVNSVVPKLVRGGAARAA
jgi:LysR family transcriptional regulator, hydrogen peroxide-inducible genes activator